MNAIKNTVSNIWNSVKSAVTEKITEIKDTIVNGFNAAVNFIKNLGSQAFQWGADIINGIVDGIKGCINKVADAVKGVADKIKSFLHFSVPDEGPLADFESWMPDFMQGLADGIRNGINDRLGGVRDAVSNAMRAVYDAVMDKVNSSWSWGRDLMQNLINGLNYMLGNLINTVADVARAISDYLHFSVPDKGPLTEFESWMPDFMKGLADGINKSKKYVEKAISGVADAMTIAMNSYLNVDMSGVTGAMAGAGGTTVVNNYNNDNSRTVNQTNNSPKSLSRLEIYRQTRNALNV